VALLESWDGRRVDDNSDGKYDNPAQVVMDKWVELALKNTFEDDLGPFFQWYGGRGFFGPGEITTGAKILYHCLLGDKSSIENKYDFFNGVPVQQVVLTSLTQALAQLKTEYGTADMTQWKASVVPHVFSAVNFENIPQTNPSGVLSLPRWMNRGTQNDMVVLKPGGIYGVNVCPPGQSGFIAPDNQKDKHYSDQMDLYKNFESKPMLFELDDVKADMESVIRLIVY
jgi:penicillin amidase